MPNCQVRDNVNIDSLSNPQRPELDSEGLFSRDCYVCYPPGLEYPRMHVRGELRSLALKFALRPFAPLLSLGENSSIML